MATEEVIVEERRGPNPLLIVAAILAFVVIFGLFVVRPLLFPGGADEEELPPAAVDPAPTTSPSPQPTEAPPAETFEVFESKDPFRPLIVVAAAGAGGGGTTGGTTGTTGGGGTTTGGTTGTTGGGTGGGGAGGGAAPTGGQRVALMDVFDDNGQTKAQVKVGSTVYTVSPGETFADSYKLLSVNGNCGTFLRGDDKFTLCEGEEILK